MYYFKLIYIYIYFFLYLYADELLNRYHAALEILPQCISRIGVSDATAHLTKMTALYRSPAQFTVEFCL